MEISSAVGVETAAHVVNSAFAHHPFPVLGRSFSVERLSRFQRGKALVVGAAVDIAVLLNHRAAGKATVRIFVREFSTAMRAGGHDGSFEWPKISIASQSSQLNGHLAIFCGLTYN